MESKAAPARAKHTFKIGERVSIIPEINVINLFNRASVTNINNAINRSGALTEATSITRSSIVRSATRAHARFAWVCA